MFKNVTTSPVSVQPNVRVISVSKGKKGKNKSPRSKFFSALMTNLAGHTGDAIGEAFTSGDHEKFRSMMVEIADKMAKIEK